MLVLSRKTDQDLLIGNDIRITVLRVNSNRVVLGVDAPDAVRVLRGELSFETEDISELSNDEVDPPQRRAAALPAA